MGIIITEVSKMMMMMMMIIIIIVIIIIIIRQCLWCCDEGRFYVGIGALASEIHLLLQIEKLEKSQAI